MIIIQIFESSWWWGDGVDRHYPVTYPVTLYSQKFGLPAILTVDLRQGDRVTTPFLEGAAGVAKVGSELAGLFGYGHLDVRQYMT
jgi:hypothetical protein